MKQVKSALSYHGHDYTWKDLVNRTASLAFGWKELGWPYTGKRLVRDLVQQLRGGLKITSVPGQGTCITLFIPANLDASLHEMAGYAEVTR